MMTSAASVCGLCSEPIARRAVEGIGPAALDDRPICNDCASSIELSSLVAEGEGCLYDCDDVLTDWTGGISVYAQRRRISSGCGNARGADPPAFSRHNIAGKRYDVWFRLPGDAFLWHGVRYGDNTQLVHCRRTKATEIYVRSHR